MKSTKVFDLPTRLFHWLFASHFIAAFYIAKTYDDDSLTYIYHKLLGLSLALIVILRIGWGLFGSRYARFASFQLKPNLLINYFKNFLKKDQVVWVGHNPPSSWIAVVLMVCALGLTFTGIQMSRDVEKEIFEEIHEYLSTAFIVISAIHVLGVLIHTFRHKDALALSMIHGKKRNISFDQGILRSCRVAGFLFIFVVGIFGFYLIQNYNQSEGILNIFGHALQIGE